MAGGGTIMAVVVAFAVAMDAATGARNKHVTGNVTQTLDFLLATNRYDKRLRPNFGGSPLTISVNFFIKSMGPVSDNDQSFGLDCYFRQHWYDLRLRYQKLPGLEEFSMSWLFLDRVWKPDTYFINGKRSFLHRITVPNKFLRLRHDGFITYSMRLTISASCPMYLRKFPLDAQRCPLVLGSYGYSNKDLVYKWTDASPIGLQDGVEIAQFDLVNITTEDEKTMVKGGFPFSTVQANFWLKRHTGYFMLQVYIPCGLIVVCSWISFWIDPDAVPARVTLGVTTVLSLTTMGFGGRAQLPKVSYWTALDWFVIICFTSVFSVMIEYAIVNFIDKFKKDLKCVKKRKKEEEEEEEEEKTRETEKKSKKSFRTMRSASFSCSPSRSVFAMSRSRSIPANFDCEVQLATIPGSSIDEELTEPGAEMEQFDVVLDVEDSRDVGDVEEVKEETKRKFFAGFLKNIKKPLWSLSGSLDLGEGAEPPDKFSKIDVQSRKNFPIAFLLSLVFYLYAFSYYLTDEIPSRDSHDVFK